MSKRIEFLASLNYLGGNLGLSPIVEGFVDLEEFFLDCTDHLNEGSRTALTILNWLHRYGVLLSPSKIRRLIKGGYSFNRTGLKELLNFLEKEKIVGPHFFILKKYTPSRQTMNKCLPKIFSPNGKKYLKNKSFVLKNCIELRFRAEGASQVVADVRAYLGKKKPRSLYEIAKATHSPRNRVNEEYRSLGRFGVIGPGL